MVINFILFCLNKEILFQPKIIVNQIEEGKNLAIANIKSEKKQKLEQLAEEYKHYNTASKHLFWVAI